MMMVTTMISNVRMLLGLQFKDSLHKKVKIFGYRIFSIQKYHKDNQRSY